VEVLAYGGFSPKPLRLGLPHRRRNVDLNELESTCHLLFNSTFTEVFAGKPFQHRDTKAQRRASIFKKYS
jgi:hypothetical protein